MTRAAIALAVVGALLLLGRRRREPAPTSWGRSGPHYTSNTGEEQLVPMAAWPTSGTNVQPYTFVGYQHHLNWRM